LVSIGEEVVPALSSGKIPPIYVIGGTSATCNHNLLKYWANATGGIYFNLQSISDDKKIVSQIGKSGFAFISVVADSTDDISDVYPSQITPLGMFLIRTF
jgi:hypothetical protein